MRRDDVGAGGDPASVLVEPWPADAVGEEWNAVSDFMHSIPSLGQFAWKAFELVSGQDVPDMWGDMIAGDWTNVSRVATACRLLGGFCQAYEARLDSAVAVARYEWHGTAAQAMDTYFAGLAASVGSMQEALEDIAKAVDSMAFGIRHCHDEVASICESLVDAILGVTISLGAMAASGWTGFGAIASGFGLSASTLFAISLVNDAKAAMQTAFDLAEGIMSTLTAMLSLVGEIEVVPLPSDPYDNRVAD
ncbi:WXG100 family type VII secretion target [Phycicoccus sonneratiae]|uniref:Type VII secretion system (Wss) protein ESAT-6 n=1 Tax=Phycicoccus sonneratiae TaxID=2807628 RepID=A0ABS2CN30_9MICO|nr:hypothetical protein [Phycicoccus sonneraticus]MBM6401268.1 hypothetical protein [Phycicoccus sonneraticus]